MGNGFNKIASIHKAVRCLSAIVCLVLLSACSYHPPSPIDEKSSARAKRQLNSDGTYYVRSGDTLYAIAFGFGVDPMSVAKWNGISSPYTIYPGQMLRLSTPPAGSRNSGSSAGIQISAVKTPAPAKTRTSSSPAKTSQTDPKSWKWPTRGRVLRSYVAGDPARNGLDIAGREGQAIIASSAGHVVYSGNGLIGYGELIIIKHNEKMLSAYAHNKIRLVKEGDRVSAGQKIAEMGRNTGNEQLLHFEIRAHGKPVNPLSYLPKK